MVHQKNTPIGEQVSHFLHRKNEDGVDLYFGGKPMGDWGECSPHIVCKPSNLWEACQGGALLPRQGGARPGLPAGAGIAGRGTGSWAGGLGRWWEGATSMHAARGLAAPISAAAGEGTMAWTPCRAARHPERGCERRPACAVARACGRGRCGAGPPDSTPPSPKCCRAHSY